MITRTFPIHRMARRLGRILLPTFVALFMGVAARPAAAQTGAAPTTTGSFSGPYTLLSNANTPGNSAWFTGPVAVSFAAAPGTGGGLSTVYALDGGGPLAYSLPVFLTGDGLHTVTFYSTDVLSDIEGVNTQTLSVDTTPPTTTASFDGSAVTLTATDAVSGVAATFYTLDGGATQTYAQPVLLAAGTTHQVRFWSVDRAGNVETAHALAQDLSAPATTASVAGPAGKGGWYVGPVTVTLTATDPDGPADVAATDYTLDGGAAQTCSAPVSVSGDGTHSFVFWSVDRSGNVEAAHTLPLQIDATPPALAFGAAAPAPNAAGWSRTSVAFPWAATDAASGLVGAAGGAATVSTEGTGQTATVAVADVAGNSQTFTTPGVSVDLTPPVTTSAVAGAVVTLSATDALSGVAATYYTLDGGAAQAYSQPVTLLAGSHSLTFWSVDVAGNVETANALTTSPPSPTTTASVSGPAGSGGWYVGPVTVTLSATETGGPGTISATYYTMDGGAAQTYSTPVVVSGDGTHSFVYWSVDVSGLTESTHTLSFQIDATPPALAFQPAAPAPNAAGWNRTPVAFPWTATDATSGLAGAAGGAATVSGEGKGQTGTVTVADVAGNSQTFTTPGVSVDLTPPVTTSTVAGAVVTLSAADALSGVAATFYTLDGGAALTYAAPVTVTGAGSHTLTFWSVDVAGNVEAKHTLPLTVAVPLPSQITLKSSLTTTVYGQAVTLTATVAPSKPGGGAPTGTVTVSEGGSALGAATLTGGIATLPLPPLNVGTHTLTAAYSGDSVFAPVTSAALTQKVSQSATTITMTAPSPTVPLGHAVTVTFTVTPVVPGGGVPTGTVTLADKARASLGPMTLTGGRATLATAGLALGPHTLTAVYSGDNNFVRSTAATLTVTVTATKIMPMGDSLTWGQSLAPAAQATGGYRGPLYAQTVGQGWAVQYVGSAVNDAPLGGCEGHPGWTVEMALPVEPARVAQYQPDVILLMLGTNDLRQSIPVSQALTDMGTLLDALSAAKPGVQIIVASVPPLDSPPATPAQTAAYNAGLPGVVQQAASRGDVVSFVDMHTLCGWVASDYEPPTCDGTHPNSSGYAKMATVWYNVLAPLPLAH